MDAPETAPLDGEGQFLTGWLLVAMPGIEDPRTPYGLIHAVANCLDDSAIITSGFSRRGLVAEIGFEKAFLEYDQPPRLHGETHHSIFVLVEMALLALTTYSRCRCG